MMRRTLIMVGLCCCIGTRLPEEIHSAHVQYPSDRVIGVYGTRNPIDIPLWPLIDGRHQQTIDLRAVSSICFTVLRRPSSTPWSVQILRDDEPLDTFDSRSGDAEHCSIPLSPGRVTILVTGPRDEPLEVRLDATSDRGTKNVPSTISHTPPQMVPIVRQSRDIQARGRSVALLEIEKAGGPVPCTGFLLSNDLLVTAHHCIASDRERSHAHAYFDFDGVARRVEVDLARIEFPVAGSPSERLDVTICRLARAVSGRQRLRLAQRNPKGGDSLVIIHHSEGDPKQVTQGDCRVIDETLVGSDGTATDFGHNCDTAGGSSGSPVFDADGNVVAVHHLGWDEDRGILVNRAVRLDTLLRTLASTNSSLLSEVTSK